MARRALWRKHPDDPHSLVGYVVADREWYYRSLFESLGCLAQAGFFWLFVTGHFASAAGLLAVGLLKPLLKKRRKSVASMLTLPLPAPTFPCDVVVSRLETTVGLDRGLVTFIDGWLHFEGQRTSFSLSRDDVQKRDQNRIWLREGGEIEFSPDDSLKADGLERVNLRSNFNDEIDRWYRLGKAAQGLSILPPLTLHPSGVARAWGDLVRGVLGAVLGISLFVAIYTYASFGYCFFALMFTGNVVDSIRNFRNMRRFVRENPRPLVNETRGAIGPNVAGP